MKKLKLVSAPPPGFCADPAPETDAQPGAFWCYRGARDWKKLGGVWLRRTTANHARVIVVVNWKHTVGHRIADADYRVALHMVDLDDGRWRDAARERGLAPDDPSLPGMTDAGWAERCWILHERHAYSAHGDLYGDDAPMMLRAAKRAL